MELFRCNYTILRHIFLTHLFLFLQFRMKTISRITAPILFIIRTACWIFKTLRLKWERVRSSFQWIGCNEVDLISILDPCRDFKHKSRPSSFHAQKIYAKKKIYDCKLRDVLRFSILFLQEIFINDFQTYPKN